MAKYFWALFVVVAFVLFIPDDAAKQIGLAELQKRGHRGGLRDGRLFLPATRRLFRGTLYDGRENCQGWWVRYIFWGFLHPR